MKNNRATGDPRRVPLVVGAILAVAVAASLLWVRGADERRVNAACGTWLDHRESLRTALSESVEAAERARAAHAPSPKRYFNDFESTSAALGQWLGASPSVIGSLDPSSDASGLEHGTVKALDYIQSGVADLQQLIDNGNATDVLDWTSELDARFQNLDDFCLTAARNS